VGGRPLARLPGFERLRPEVRAVLEAAREAAAPSPIYAVGGYVRDLLLGRDTGDIDLVVEGDAVEVARRLGQILGVPARLHPRFGTASLLLPGGLRVDLATARAERYPRAAALPLVRPASLAADLARRDFSVNAIAARLEPDRFGSLIDPFGGRSDLQAGAIRVLHDRSFIDDPTRIFRAVRLAARYRMRIAPGTIRLIRDAVQRRALSSLAPSRILTELLRIGREPSAARAFRRLAALGVLEALHPALADLSRVSGPLARGIPALHAALPALRAPDPGVACLLLLVARLPSGMARGVLGRLGARGRTLEGLLRSLAAARAAARRLARVRDLRPSRIAPLVEPLAPEAKVLLLATLEGPARRKRVLDYVTRLRTVKPMLTGDDLARLGLSPGPLYRRILDALRAARLDGRVRSVEDEIAFVHRRFGGGRLED